MFLVDQVFKESPNPTYIKDYQGRVVWANTAYANLHGTNLPLLLANGKVDFDFSYERDLEVLSTDEVSKVEEFYKLGNGKEAWFLTVKNAIVQPGNTKYLLSTSSDITNLKENIQVVEDSFATKDKFVSDVSKGIEAPLHAVISLVRLLKQTFINKDQKRYLNSVLSITDYLLDVPKDILEYARVEAGIVNTTTEVVDIADFMHSVVRSIAPKAAEQDFTIHFSDPLIKLPPVEVNTVYLNLIIVKIIRSAIRYTKSKNINISVSQKERVDKMIYLQFGINNLGLDSNSGDLEKLFDSDNLTQNEDGLRKGGGNLGIYTCKRIISLQGGRIWLEKKSGLGSSIEFILPFPIEQAKSSDLMDSPIHPEQLSNIRLLLVEDNISSQTLVKHQIQNWSTRIDIANNGEEGVLLASQQRYDLILMDVEMPGMDGFRATSQIRATEGPNQYAPIVAFTTNVENYDLSKYKSLGFTDLLKKPYHAFDLYLCISKNTALYTKGQAFDNKEMIANGMPLYDFSGLGNMAEDAVFIRKMQKLFIDLVPGQLLKLKLGIEQQNWEGVALIAHSLKSTYGNIKVVKAADAMKRIEEIANQKTNFSELDHLMSIIQTTTQQVVDVFTQELAVT